MPSSRPLFGLLLALAIAHAQQDDSALSKADGELSHVHGPLVRALLPPAALDREDLPSGRDKRSPHIHKFFGGGGGCNTCGGGGYGGYGGGYGGGYVQPTKVIVVPVTIQKGYGGGGGHPGYGGGGCGGGGCGGGNYYQQQPNYGGGGCGGSCGGGGGGSYAQASASASSGSWGGKK